MTIVVYTNNWKLSYGDYIYAKTSQCVALGLCDLEKNLAGIAHLHSNSNHEEILDEFIQSFLKNSSKKYDVILSGGVNAFVPNYGFIRGEKKAMDVMTYLSNYKMNITHQDIFTDKVRMLRIDPINHKYSITHL